MASTRVDGKHLHERLRSSSPRERAETDGARSDVILVVDDDARVLALVQRMLEHEGATVRAFPDAQSAWDSLRIGPVVALILTDGNMPGVSGGQFVRMLRVDDQLRSIPIIGMSGAHYGFPDGIPQLAKPFTRGELRTAMRVALGRELAP